jgi:hypothetical protein
MKIQADSLDQIGSRKSRSSDRKRSLYRMWTKQNFQIFPLQGRSLVQSFPCFKQVVVLNPLSQFTECSFFLAFFCERWQGTVLARNHRTLNYTITLQEVEGRVQTSLKPIERIIRCTEVYKR